ncbi:DUF4439 domain-containing protein [Brachybacterium hainanense]|uniref:DUF4439 domain-containing protein n=1 Tax=Brachybacterium hainanense TaxID=1541174 RepID=A0ABV6RHW6_9MICO
MSVSPPPLLPASPSRRQVLRTGAAAAVVAALAACGPLRLGQPAPFTPPPVGIDDLYREDLLAAIDEALLRCSEAEDLAAEHGDLAAHLDGVLRVQRAALLTGAEAEAASTSDAGGEQPTASASSDAGGASPEPGTGDAASLVASLMTLRDLGIRAARQVSGSLARPVAAIAASAAWSSARVASLLPAAAAQLRPLPTEDEVVPTREVPEDDPPTIGAEVDFHSTIETAQRDEWFVGYVREVLAARTAGAERDAHRAASQEHRTRAQRLAEIAEEEGAPVPLREAVYPLPEALADASGAESWPDTAAHDLLVTHLALVGAAPFARRPLPILAALAEAASLGPRLAALEALPSFEEE